MMDRLRIILRRELHKLGLMGWAREVRAAERADLGQLRKIRMLAAQVRSKVDKVIHVADSRLALPRIGSNAMRKPPQSDWSYRPELWRGPIFPPGIAAIESRSKIGTATRLFHDCTSSEMTIRQMRNTRETDLAPFALRLDVFKFDGTFLSLVIDLPDNAAQGLRQNHILRVDAEIEFEKPLEVFVRLNIKHGPNVEQLVREMPLSEAQTMVEFDLATSKISENRVERLWLDLIFEGPEMNEVLLRDLTLSRHPRADF